MDSNYSSQYHPLVPPLSQESILPMTTKADTHPGGSTRRVVVPLLSQESFLGMPSQVVSHPGGAQHELAGETANPHVTSSDLKRQRLQLFWRQQMTEVEKIQDFKQHELPFARIKRIMKSNPEVKMVSADAPVLLSKASELFIMELTQISWLHAEEKKRRTVKRSDLGDAIRHKETFHFLDEMRVHREEEIAGNWLHTESLRNNGTKFPLMPANPIDQALGEDFLSRLQEIFQQPMVQQVPMSNLIPPTIYESPQDFMSRPQEIFQQSMIQQHLMSTLNPITLPELPQELVLDGNWVSTESFPNNGMNFPLMPASPINQAMNFPLMPASPINQALGEEFMSRSQEIFLQSMIKQPLMSTLTPTTVYEPTQEIFQQAMQATVYEPLQEIFQQPMQQTLMSTVTPATVYEAPEEILQRSMIQQPLMSTLTPATAYGLPQPYARSMPPDLMGQGSDRT